MSTAINVNKQTVEEFLATGKSKPFIIPEYQRPYSWTDEQIETLFRDLWDFTCSEGGTERDGTYFLGSIVSYENENGEQEIIDGQQRITSLFLLLRAIYTRLSEADIKTEEALNFINKIQPAIWRTNKLTGKVDYSSILLNSKVISDNGNTVLKKILETGSIEENSKDNYSKNYEKFLLLFKEYSSENPFMIYQFVYSLLSQVIVLPITADTQDTALTIFSTLNDRGLPLSDADIFKAKIYNYLDNKAKKTFIEKWKEIEEETLRVSENIQQLFYYYMFYLRALEKDKSSTTPGIRKYYSRDKFKKLFDPNILDDIRKIINLWEVIYNHNEIEEKWSSNKNIIKILDILTSYPNEFWKYPVIIYYLSHRDEKDFEENFLIFLRKLFIELFTKYLESPTINAVKGDILKLNTEIINKNKPKFEIKSLKKEIIIEKIKSPHRNAVRMILKVLAYTKQDELLPEKWEIEHILPVKWDNDYFLSADIETIKEKIEHIGNKIPFEKRLNIIASNNFFSKKKEIYSKSDILITKEISNSYLKTWSIDNIIERDLEMSNIIIDIIEKWNNDYIKSNKNFTETSPSDEVLKNIEYYKSKGWL